MIKNIKNEILQNIERYPTLNKINEEIEEVNGI